MRSILAIAAVMAMIVLIVTCGGDNEKAATIEDGENPSDGGSAGDDDDDDAGDDDTVEGQPCTITNPCYSGSCGDLPCWEIGENTGCDGACYVLSTPEGNAEGVCVPPCATDAECGSGWFCLPECPEIEGWFDPRWCIQDEYDELRDCPQE